MHLFSQIVQLKSDKWQQKHRVSDTYYINHNYTNVPKVHEDCVKFRTENTESAQKDKKKKKNCFWKE